jgi:hypothetical protein
MSHGCALSRVLKSTKHFIQETKESNNKPKQSNVCKKEEDEDEASNNPLQLFLLLFKWSR